MREYYATTINKNYKEFLVTCEYIFNITLMQRVEYKIVHVD